MKPYYAAILFGLLITPWISPFAPGPSPAAVPLLFSWFCILAVVGFAVTRRVAVDRLISVAAWSWLIAGVISSAMGVLQYFGAAAELSPWINQTRYGEAFANLRQRNQFATLTNIALFALIWLLLQRAQSEPGSEKRVGTTTFLGCMAAGLLMVGNAASSDRKSVV